MGTDPVETDQEGPPSVCEKDSKQENNSHNSILLDFKYKYIIEVNLSAGTVSLDRASLDHLLSSGTALSAAPTSCECAVVRIRH
jgi:hypothetical protein